MSTRLANVILKYSIRVAVFRQIIKEFYEETFKILRRDNWDINYHFNYKVILQNVSEKIDNFESFDLNVNLFEKNIVEKFFPQMSNFSQFQKFIRDKVELNSIFWRICPFCYHVIDREFGPNICSAQGCSKYLRCDEWCVNFYPKTPIKICSYDNCDNYVCDNCDHCDSHDYFIKLF